MVFVLTQLHFGQRSSLPAKFDCPVARQKFLFLDIAHDYETGLLKGSYPTLVYEKELLFCDDAGNTTGSSLVLY